MKSVKPAKAVKIQKPVSIRGTLSTIANVVDDLNRLGIHVSKAETLDNPDAFPRLTLSSPPPVSFLKGEFMHVEQAPGCYVLHWHAAYKFCQLVWQEKHIPEATTRPKKAEVA